MFLSLITGCGNNDNIGQKGTTSAVPKRIISLAPAITEELFRLKADDLLMADTFYCKRPPEAMNKKKIGNIRDFDLEMVLNIKPDLILCTKLASSKKIRKLKELGFNVKEFQPPGSFDEICSNFLSLGEAVGKKDSAEKIIRDVRKQVDHIMELTKSLPKKKVFMQIGAKPLVTVHKYYFMNDYITWSGGFNICGESETNLYSREMVLASNPDVIIIANMGIISEDEKKTWLKYPAINAVKNNQIYIVNSDVFCNPTVFTFLESLKTMTAFLHPDIKI